MNTRALLGTLVVAAVLAASSANAQDRNAEIDRIFNWATPSTPGCAVAVSHDGKMVVNRAYGLADLERSVPLTPESVFDVASVQKQFTAASILLLVEEGRLSLSEDVRRYIPELPDYGHRVTLDHLLTHTSGIRDWTGLLPMAEGDPDVLTLILRQRGLDFTPGDEWSYSSSGYELLKEIVARTSGTSFADFTRARLFEPLGMESTSYITDTKEIVRNRALGYGKTREGWKLDMNFGNDRGGGALMSTASDLLIWNRALMNGRFGPFVTGKIQEPATLNNGRKLGYARGLYLDSNRGGQIVWHTGGGAGYRSILAHYPEQRLSISIACNAGEAADRLSYARGLFDLFVPPGETSSDAGSRTPTVNRGGDDVKEVDVSGRAGLFFHQGTGEPLRLIVRNGSLGIARGPRLLMVTGEHFRNPRGSLSFRSGDEFDLRFLSDDEFELTSMEGVTTRYTRSRPYTPTEAELKALAGRYDSDEIGALLQVIPDKGGLVIRLERTPEEAIQFTPVGRDTFMQGPLTVRFLRNESGTVVGFDYSNPVVRNIRFTRLYDCTAPS